MWQLPMMPWALTQPHNITDAGFWTLGLVTIWMVLFLFSPMDTMSVISKNNLKCGLVRPQHTFPLCVSPSQMSSGPEKSAVFLDVVDICLSLCMVESELAFVDAATNCVYWQWFSKVFLSPCSILYTMMWVFNAVFNAVLPEGSKVTDIQCWFSALFLTCRDFSGFSESFNDIMDCRWWNL